MRCWMACLCWCLALVGTVPAAVAQTPVGALSDGRPLLLWLTGEITPAPRTALVQREAEAMGLAFRQIDQPLRGPATLSSSEQEALRAAVQGAALVWIDAPHASVAARLSRLLAEPLKGAGKPAVWVLPEGVTRPDAEGADAGMAAQNARVAAYLQAGGPANTRAALQLAFAVWRGQAGPDLPAPQAWPAHGLYHPDAPGVMPDAAALSRWLATRPGGQGQPTVAVLVHRYHFVNGSTAWLDAWLRLFEQRGIVAYAAFGQQVDAAGLRTLLAQPGHPDQAVPRVIVSHQLLSQGAALQGLLSQWGTPLLLTQPHRQGDQADWEADANGLSQADVPFYLAQPEGAGGMDPIMVTAHADHGRRIELITRQAEAVVNKVRRLIALQTRPVGEKRLVAMVYNYPPGGNHFGASFLNVPRSLEQVSAGLAQAGYDTRRVAEQEWIDGLQPLLAAYYPEADLPGLLARDQAAALPLKDYLAWWAQQPEAVRQRTEAQWGPPEHSRYVLTWHGQRVFVIPRLQVGRLSVLPQPPREETLHQGQNPFMHRSKTPLSHHYLAVYLWAQQADALVHFGTHGTQEWAPGKARGLDVWDDALLPLGDLPVVYPYIVDNLGEALTAKRRGRALMVSHRTPTFAPAGFEARMAHMHELMHEWETVDAGPTKVALEKSLLAQFVEHHLHTDLGWTQEDIAAQFATFLERLHPYLDTLAQSSQPKGLAVFGRVPEPTQRQQTILQALRKPLIEALGEDIDEAFLIRHDSVVESRPARWLRVALRDAEEASRLDLRAPVPDGPVPNRAARRPIDTVALHQLALRAQALDGLLQTEGEMPGLLSALNGRFIEAAYGGDPIRNPDSLPTGRNLTGLDPSRLPTRQAYEVAQGLFADWLKQYQAEHVGQVPGRLALSLWAGETLRHQGIMEAQALVAMGVRPVWDDAGRPTRLQLIPLSELQRPRVDVLLSITGSYRDQFPALMALVDQGVALASRAEPGNALARNTAQVARELRQAGVTDVAAQALAQARVFGNVVGDYGTGIAEAVQSDQLQRDDARPGQMFLQRMSQPYVAGQPLEGLPTGAAAEALGAHLRQTQAALLSRSSHLFAMVTSDDPFQYLGGLAAAARTAGKQGELGLYVSQLQDSSEVSTESAQRVVALEMQSRYLHPGWLQAQKQEGYAGTLQVLKAVQFAWGWQVMAPGVVRPDHWQSFHDVLVQDKYQLGVPTWLRGHPQAYAQALERLIQAQRLGHWQPDEATRRQLAERYRDLTRQVPLHNELPGVRQWVAATLNEPPVGLSTATTAAQAVRPVTMDAPTSADRSRARPGPAPSPPAVPPMPARGILLNRQVPDALDPSAALTPTLSTLLVWALLGLWACGGALWQARRHPSLSRSAF